MSRIGRWVAGFVVVVFAVVPASAQDSSEGGRLKLVESAPRDELDSVVTAVISPDGKFLYASSWKLGAVLTFARDQQTGKLDLKQTVIDPENLAGVTGLALSPDGLQAVAVAFRSKTAVLYYARSGERPPQPPGYRARRRCRSPAGFPDRCGLLPRFEGDQRDRRRGPRRGRPGVRGLVPRRRRQAGRRRHRCRQGGCYAGARGLAFHPDGKSLFVASSRAGSLVVADRDPVAGWTKVRQVIKDEERDVHALAGAMGVVVSRDGRTVYVTSGRFDGDNAVSAFRLGTNGRLALIQEMVNGQG